MRPRRQADVQNDVEILGELPVGGDSALDQRSDHQSAHVERHLAGFDLLDVEQVVDQPDQAFAIAVRDGDQTRGFFLQPAHRPAGQQGQRAADRRQRGAQFVADGGDEFALHALGMFAMGDIADRGDEPGVLLVAEPADGDLGFEGRAVGPLADELLPLARSVGSGAADAGQPGEALSLIERMSHQEHVAASEHVLRGVTEHPLDARIGADDAAARIEQQHPVDRTIEHHLFLFRHPPRAGKGGAALRRGPPDQQRRAHQKQRNSDQHQRDEPLDIAPLGFACRFKGGKHLRFCGIQPANGLSDPVHQDPSAPPGDPLARFRRIAGIGEADTVLRNGELLFGKPAEGGQALDRRRRAVGLKRGEDCVPPRDRTVIGQKKLLLTGQHVSSHTRLGIEMQFEQVGQVRARRHHPGRLVPQHPRIGELVAHQQLHAGEANQDQRQREQRQIAARRKVRQSVGHSQRSADTCWACQI